MYINMFGADLRYMWLCYLLCSLGLKDPQNYKYCVSLLMLVCSLEESEVPERLSNLSCVLEGSFRWACALRVLPSSVRRRLLFSCLLIVQVICQMILQFACKLFRCALAVSSDVKTVDVKCIFQRCHVQCLQTCVDVSSVEGSVNKRETSFNQ